MLASTRPINYFVAVNTLEEIEQAAEQLAPSDFDRLALWVSNRYHDLWKRQMERDATDGKLDFLFQEADVERQTGLLRDWPSGAE